MFKDDLKEANEIDIKFSKKCSDITEKVHEIVAPICEKYDIRPLAENAIPIHSTIVINMINPKGTVPNELVNEIGEKLESDNIDIGLANERITLTVKYN